jgi:hypothetical protein
MTGLRASSSGRCVGWDPCTALERSRDVGTRPRAVRPCMCCPVYFMAIALMQPECNSAHATETRFGVLPNLPAARSLMTSRADAASVSHHSCICVLRNRVAGSRSAQHSAHARASRAELTALPYTMQFQPLPLPPLAQPRLRYVLVRSAQANPSLQNT